MCSVANKLASCELIEDHELTKRSRLCVAKLGDNLVVAMYDLSYLHWVVFITDVEWQSFFFGLLVWANYFEASSGKLAWVLRAIPCVFLAVSVKSRLKLDKNQESRIRETICTKQRGRC